MMARPAEGLSAAALAQLDGVKRAGNGWLMRCPSHSDDNASLSFRDDSASGKLLVNCFAGCRSEDILSALRDRYLLPMPTPKADRPRKPRTSTGGARQLVATYEYRDEDGRLLFLKRKFLAADGKKTFRQEAADGTPSLSGVRQVIYRLPELLAADRTQPVFWVEGEKDADNLAALGFVATTSGSSASWRSEFANWLRGRDVCILPDADEPGRKHAATVAADVGLVARSIRLVELPGANDVSAWLAAGGTADELLARYRETPATEPEAPPSLSDVLTMWRKYMHGGDTDALLAVLGAVASARLPGAADRPPVWLCLIGQPSSGKTEKLNVLAKVPGCHSASTITEAAMLSGTPSRERAKGAAGGLLVEIGAAGVLICKDFGSILSMNHDARAAALAMLREVYDGAVTRRVGSDGGRALSWRGHVTLLAAATGIIDQHSQAIGALGERWLTYRLPAVSDTDEKKDSEAHAMAAFQNTFGERTNWRAELTGKVAALFANFQPDVMPDFPDADQREIAQLCAAVVRARAAVVRSGYSRDIEHVCEPEAPARLAVELGGLRCGMLALGVDAATVSRIVRKVARDGIPDIRRRVLDWLAIQTDFKTTREARLSLSLPMTTVRRTLEDLEAQRLVVTQTKPDDAQAYRWKMADSFRESWRRLADIDHQGTVPEKSSSMCVGVSREGKSGVQTSTSDFSGTVTVWPKVALSDQNR